MGRQIDERLLDEIGMIDGGGDTVGSTCQYAIAYDDWELFQKIDLMFEIYDVGEKRQYIFYRSHHHELYFFMNDINDMSRDHIFWLKIAQKYFESWEYEHYFRSLKPFGKISDKHRMSLDTYLFCRNKNLLWQLSLLYILPVTLLTKLIHWIWLPQTTPDKFEPKPRIHKYSDNGEIFYALADKELNLYYDDLGRIKTLKELLNVNAITMKAGKWKFLEYLFAEIWLITYRPYTLYQTAWALYVSKNIPALTWILKRCLRWMTWEGNSIIYLLTGKNNIYDISNIGTEVCNKYMNQDHADRIEEKTEENSFKVKIYEDLIVKLKK